MNIFWTLNKKDICKFKVTWGCYRPTVWRISQCWSWSGLYSVPLYKIVWISWPWKWNCFASHVENLQCVKILGILTIFSSWQLFISLIHFGKIKQCCLCDWEVFEGWKLVFQNYFPKRKLVLMERQNIPVRSVLVLQWDLLRFGGGAVPWILGSVH